MRKISFLVLKQVVAWSILFLTLFVVVTIFAVDAKIPQKNTSIAIDISKKINFLD